MNRFTLNLHGLRHYLYIICTDKEAATYVETDEFGNTQTQCFVAEIIYFWLRL